MITRVLEIDNLDEAQKEMLKVGVNQGGIDIMGPKSIFRAIKLNRLPTTPANILKQEMLSLGGEAATAQGVINHSIDMSDVLLLGTMKQYQLLIEKLKLNKFKLPELADDIQSSLNNYDAPAVKTKIMGILNVTPDSFSDGGKFLNPETAIAQARKMVEEGADIIDVGGESTRPGSDPVSAEEEKKRVIPIIEKLSKEIKALISIDTTKAEVAKAAIEAGAGMVNDISGLRFDKNMAKVVAEKKVPICIMHIKGTPGNMHDNPEYIDLMGEIINYLSEGLEIAKKAGILTGNIIVDPGIGFGKSVEDNLEIIKRLKELKGLGCPVLIGPSRKSFIGKILGLDVNKRLEGTIAAVVMAIANGANIVRVHDVAAIKKATEIANAINSSKGGVKHG